MRSVAAYRPSLAFVPSAVLEMPVVRAIFFLAMVGCATDTASVVVDSTEKETLRMDEGTATAFGLVSFLNDSATTREVLDHQVPLDSRAANNIIEFRCGPDGVLGTNDDNLFTTRDGSILIVHTFMRC